MTAPLAPTAGLPRGLRLAAGLCLVLSAFSGLFALQELTGLLQLSELREAAGSAPAWWGHPELAQRGLEAQLTALEGMREGRAAILAGLSVACFVSLIASARLLRPAGLRRENMRRLLGVSALAAAVLRTIDGAQWTVVARRVGSALAEGMAALPELQEPAAGELLPNLPWVAAALAAAWTALMVGAFLLLAQYFRSERVRSALALLDGKAPAP